MAKDKDDDNPYELLLEGVRASYLHCFEPYKAKQAKANETPKYSMKALIDKDDQEDMIDLIWEKIEDVIEDKWGDEMTLDDFDPTEICFTDGDKGRNKRKPECKGMMVLSASNASQPVVMDRDKTDLLETNIRTRPYSGCFVDVIVRIWAQDNEWGQRVNASFEAVQFVEDGEAFSSAPPVNAESKFKDHGPAKGGKKSRRRSEEEDEEPRGRSRRSRARDDDDEDDDDDDEDDEPRSRRRRSRR